MAWDRFKEDAVQADKKNMRPVSAALRKLFAGDLAGRNAVEGFFRVLIPPEYAEKAFVFVPSIAEMLPSLALWERRRGGAPLDGEDGDMALLKREYAAFLERNGFFEPAWERPPLRDREHEYYLFFYEAMEDFDEFAGLLKPEKTVHLIGTPPAGEGSLFLYGSSRAEIRAAALEIRALHGERNIPWDDIAVSVPGYGDLEPYLLREFSLYGIPCSSRSGRFLGDYGPGRLFSLAAACTVNNFSFTSLKALILNEHLPWRCPGINRELIEFGIVNNCVSGYREGGRVKDIWIEAFGKSPGKKRLQGYYEALKGALEGMTGAEKFSDIRKHYFAFRGPVRKSGGGPNEWDAGFLSMDAVTPEGDAALARCIEELSALARLEEEYGEIMPRGGGVKSRAFDFFLSALGERRYVPQNQGGGVSIFDYRVAAGAPFACHFVLNASQAAASVRYRPLKFLRADKRKKLGFEDRDVSDVFFRLYGAAGTGETRVRISASEESFSGWSIPHSFFAGRVRQPPEIPEDPFLQEREWWAAGGPVRDARGFPSMLFPVQRGGFDRWRRTLAGAGAFSLLRGPFPAGSVRELVRETVEKQRTSGGGLLKVSATGDLDYFVKCPASWYYRRICGLEEFSLEAKMLDDASLGRLYHAILKRLFEEIRSVDRVFKSENLELYRAWTARFTGEAVHNYEVFQGPLAAPILEAQARAITRRLCILLKTEARYFDGFEVGELEVKLESARGGMLLNGIIDRVSVSPEGQPVIIDYKTGGEHSRKASTESEKSSIRQFQIPLYVRLYEEHRGLRAGGAFFMLINRHELTAVMGRPEKKRGLTREEFQKTLDALEERLEEFASAIERLDFSSPGIPLKDCMGCPYRSICRTPFFLNALPAKTAESPDSFRTEADHVH
jgi:RecB family exonuclease